MVNSPPFDDSSLEDRFQPIFEPRTVAVIGASTNPESTGYQYVANNRDLGFECIYPVNPNASEVYGLEAYSHVSDVPAEIDLAIIVLPAEMVPDVLEDCVTNGVKAAHIVSGGFSEMEDEDGKRLEREIEDIVSANDIRVIGPNCLGVFNPEANLTHSWNAPTEPGGVAFVSHSGGFTIDIESLGEAYGIRFSKCASIGNSVDVGVTDLLEYLTADPKTDVISMYIEGVPDRETGRRLFELLRAATEEKPVVAFKGGESTRGEEATMSHTGTLAGDRKVWNAMFEQTGVTTVHSLSGMINVLTVYSMIPDFTGRNVALIGPGGGRAVTAVDTCRREGLEVPDFDGPTVTELHDLEFDVAGNLSNPVDVPFSVLGRNNGRNITSILETVLEDPNIDVAVVHINMNHFLESSRHEKGKFDLILEEIRRINSDSEIPIVVVLRNAAHPDVFEMLYDQRQESAGTNLPVFDSIETATVSLRKCIEYHVEYPDM